MPTHLVRPLFSTLPLHGAPTSLISTNKGPKAVVDIRSMGFQNLVSPASASSPKKDHETAELAAASQKSHTRKRHYHENSALPSSSSSRAVSRVSHSTASQRERSKETAPAMAHSPLSTQASCLVNSEQIGRNDSENHLFGKCSWPQCTTQINVTEHPVCPEHTPIFLQGNHHFRASAAPEPRAASLPTKMASDSNPNPKKVLPEKQILRKAASSGAPRFDGQPTQNLKYSNLPPLPPKTKGNTSSPSPNKSTAPITEASTTVASAPPQVTPPPLPLDYSPPMSPTSLKDMEPPKKRQKVSPALLQSNESRLNGNGVVANPLSSQQSPEKRTEKERRTSSKQSKPIARGPVRITAPLRRIRWTDEPNDVGSSTSINGIAPFSTGNQPSERRPDLKPPFSSISLNQDQGGEIDRLDIVYAEPPPPTRTISTSRQETLEIFSTAHSAAPDPHQSRADYFAQETQSSLNRVDGLPDSPSVYPAGNQMSTPKAKRPKKLAINTKQGQPPKVTRPVTPTDLDYFIYSQPGAAAPPPGLAIHRLKKVPPLTSTSTPSSAVSQQQQQPPKQELQKDEPLALDIDPRIHYPQPHSIAWHAMKAQEIEARGTRKQRFGKAAQSLKRLMEAQAESNVPWEEMLPEKIQENPAWVRALKGLRGAPPPTPGTVEPESPMDVTMDGTGANPLVDGNGAFPNAGTLPVNGAVEKKVRKMKRTGSGLSVVSRDGKLSFGNHQQGTPADGGSVNGSFDGANGLGMN
ncbi:hypothetical protein QBC40DRAFT_349501 [Triangularia verruculosa]|uniref:Uncharacterized protein n=1 Tax=Triangularia verruculosa TaxID=2587418 RepID=A0AAN6XFK8_9PEZI|nr:hypothetical protein QBC40DRAFT_349501 [Triangularia verruculosa]